MKQKSMTQKNPLVQRKSKLLNFLVENFWDGGFAERF